MEQYLLTQEDIDRLGITGVMAGEPATIDEMKLLGVPVGPSQQPAIQPDEPVAQQTTGAAQPATNTGVEEMLAQGAQGKPVASMTQEDDPYSNLSKTQRRMLAYAAISDAGAALQGKQGTMVTSLLGDFTKRADMQRKAKATEQARQLMGQLGMQLQSIQDPTAKMELLNQYLMQGVIDAQTYTAFATQLQNQIASAQAATSAAEGASLTLNTVKDIQDLVSSNAELTTGPIGWALSKIPFTEAAQLQDLIGTLRSNMALGALKNLKAGGATLGSVSEKELKLLEDEIAALDPAKGVDFFNKQLLKVQNRYRSIVRKAYERDDVNPAELDAIFGGRPTWISQPTAPTESSVPTLEDLEQQYGG
jgi:hypothetical protein